MAWKDNSLSYPSGTRIAYEAARDRIVDNETSRGWTDIIKSTNNYSIVGMDITKVQSAIDAIERYTNAIMECAVMFNEKANMNQSIKSEEIQRAVYEYIGRVERRCYEMCNTFSNFISDINNASNAWKTVEQIYSSQIDLDTSADVNWRH